MPLKPPDAAVARRQYYALSLEGRRRFDAFAGINDFASPEIGEAYQTTADRQAEGFQTFNDTLSGTERGTLDVKHWNVHWAGVVLQDGPDRITLENFAGADPRSWFFRMSGPSCGAYHEQRRDSQAHGSHAITMAVRAVARL